MPIKAFFPLALSLTIAPALSFSTAIVNPCSAIAIAARTYGTDGRDGSNGRSGDSGASGVNQTVEASDQLLELNLSGAEGEDGEDGTRGERGRCRNHNRPDGDVKAASGGDGGNGGSGGDGGNGGDITVYYTDRAHLRNVLVNASGGRGGRGGRGENGGQGCNCHEYSWSQTECSDGNCETEHFSCKDGDDGRDGSSGSRGSDGRTGQARIVDKTLLAGERLEADSPVVERAIATLPTAPVELSRNLWQTRTRARSLFNSGSVIDDTYQAYMGRVEKQFQLIWEASYPQQQASGVLNVSLNEQGEIKVSAPEDLWIDGELTELEGLSAYRVQYALLASDATNLSVGRTAGRGEQFVLNVLDLSGKSDIIETQFHIRYKTKSEGRRGRYVTRYEGVLSEELSLRDHNRFTLNIGQLPVDQEYLKPDTEARLEITATRTLADNTAEQALAWNGQI